LMMLSNVLLASGDAGAVSFANQITDVVRYFEKCH
jgi:hypothetical protein